MSIDYVYSPLVVSTGIDVMDNVTPAQQYDVAEHTYTPDYTIAHLQLRPWFQIADPDGVLPDGEVAAGTDMNVTWKAIEGGVESNVVSGSDYTIDSTGLLMVKRNIDPDKPLTLRVTMEYADPRTGARYERTESILVTCQSISAPPVLQLDAPVAVMYDPVFDISKPIRKIKASLLLGGKDVPASQRRFVWEKKDVNNDWHEIFADATKNDFYDYDISLNTDQSELTVNCEYIGDRIDVRCYALYDPYGSPATKQIAADTPVVEFAVIRHAPKLRGETLCPKRVNPKLKQVKPEVKIYSGDRLVPNPETVLDIAWKQAKGVSNGAVTYGSAVATGTAKPTLSTSNIAQLYGGKITPFFGAKLPLAALKTADGREIVTADGAPILARPSQT